MATEERRGPAVHQENEFDRIYAFYQRLERQERRPRLAWLIFGCSAVVALVIAIWMMQHPAYWNKVAKPVEVTGPR